MANPLKQLKSGLLNDRRVFLHPSDQKKDKNIIQSLTDSEGVLTGLHYKAKSRKQPKQ
jgi:hypothetical protein